MTNTHITIGGHKVTTNKVGQVHQIPVSGSASTGYKLDYVVINGICIVTGYLDRIVPMSLTVVATGLPKTKMEITQGNANAVSPGDPVISRIQNNSGAGALLVNNSGSSNAGIYLTMSYPVADDWVES